MELLKLNLKNLKYLISIFNKNLNDFWIWNCPSPGLKKKDNKKLLFFFKLFYFSNI